MICKMVSKPWRQKTHKHKKLARGSRSQASCVAHLREQSGRLLPDLPATDEKARGATQEHGRPHARTPAWLPELRAGAASSRRLGSLHLPRAQSTQAVPTPPGFQVGRLGGAMSSTTLRVLYFSGGLLVNRMTHRAINQTIVLNGKSNDQFNGKSHEQNEWFI